MPSAQEVVDRFMSTYELNTRSSDAAAVAAQFADTFVVAGPDGPVVVPAALFAQKLPSRKLHLDQAGLRQSKLVARDDIRINDRYVLVNTKWKMDFLPADQPARTFLVESSFLLDLGGREPKILVYLSGQDIFQLLRQSQAV